MTFSHGSETLKRVLLQISDCRKPNEKNAMFFSIYV